MYLMTHEYPMSHLIQMIRKSHYFLNCHLSQQIHLSLMNHYFLNYPMSHLSRMYPKIH